MKSSEPIRPTPSPEKTIPPFPYRNLLLVAALLLLALVPAPAQAAVVPTWCEENEQKIDIEPEECQALEDLYVGTAGGGWSNSSGWLDSLTICSGWHGVDCEGGSVVRLTLNTNKLVGMLPGSLSNLSALTSLDLTENELSGPIPASLGSLENLTALLLARNLLEGPIPPELSQLKNLTQLDLGKNKLSGPIPTEIGNMANLTSLLFLEGNQLEGPIPEGICNRSLTSGSIDYNKLDVSDLSPAACDALFLNWRLTQTVPPTSLSAEAVTVNTVEGSTDITADVTVSWLPITYTEDGGSYEVFTRHLVSDHIESRGETADKTAESLQVNIPGDPTLYAYFVRTNTPAHPGNPNNDLASVDSEEVEIDTVAVRMLDIQANTPLLYLPALAPLALLLLTGIAVVAVHRKQ